MVYLSHPVRRIRENPNPDATVTLVVEVDPARLADDAVERAARDADGEVVKSLPFDSYAVRLPETAVAAFCETPGLETVETGNVLGHGDAGEDLE